MLRVWLAISKIFVMNSTSYAALPILKKLFKEK